MNIVYFYPNLKDAAGTERMLNIKANYFADIYGYNVTIITYTQFDNPIFFEFSKKIKFIHFNIQDPAPNFKNMSNKEQKKQYKNFIQTYRKAVENYLYNNPTDIAISMYMGAEHKFLPLIKDGSKKIMEFHFHFDIASFSKKLKEKWSFQNLKMKIQTFLFQRVLNKYDKIVVLTEQDEKEWSTYFDNVTNIPNHITITPIRANMKIEKVLAVGRFTYQKGFDFLIEAWSIVNKKFPNWRLDIYGHGELENDLREQIKSLNLDNSITLFPPDKNINHVFANHSIFALSSRFEGFPLVLIEALASGLPPVAFECKNGPKQMMGNSILKHFLVKPNDIKDFAEKLIILMQNNDLRTNMSQEASNIAKQYELCNIMEIWKEKFDNLIKK